MPTRGRWALVLIVVTAIVAAGFGGFSVPAARAASSILPAEVYFSQTGHNLGGDFLSAWQDNGGLMVFGYPISEPITENGRTVQYFERARFELHPEYAGTRYVVEASLLGDWATQSERSTPPFQPRPTNSTGDSNCTFYPETGHYLCNGFRNYWEQNGGLWVYGYPISEEFQQKNPDTGQTYTVQYFERARFEYHPENAGTPYEVLLGRLGASYAAAQGVNTAPVPPASNAIDAFQGLLDPAWSHAIHTADGSIVGVVTTDSLNIRSAPSVNAPVVGTTYARHPIMIDGVVQGDAVGGIPVWYEVGQGQYVAAAYVSPFVPSPPPQTFSGHWVDVNLSQFYAVAYDGSQPVYAAIITAGASDNPTPTGVYQVLERVPNATMDSATVGIPKGSPGYYYLTNVLFTQYFKSGGYALHQNWWTPPGNFGNYSTHGCVGLLLPDAQWFWNFLSIGSTVSIHN
ncbi:MAG TPA: L,D-transpeptidase family protein [Thermomicrobiaceae bacterium]|nr:L,D-transpeptidase family protein [Thermomicrobiaceae bacterium]